jgi:hypothetical protein
VFGWKLHHVRQANAMPPARISLGREGPPEAVTIAPEGARLTEEQWALVCPLLPPQRGGIGKTT